MDTSNPTPLNGGPVQPHQAYQGQRPTKASRGEAPLTTCTRRLQFCAGHRVFGHESKCAHPHGHNYVAYFTARMRRGLATRVTGHQPCHEGGQVNYKPIYGRQVDSINRVIDFSVLKERIGGWIERYWDHKFLLHTEDLDMRNAFQAGGFDALFFLPYNPTAEGIARYLLTEVCPAVLEGTDVEVVKVKVVETENCSATVKL